MIKLEQYKESALYIKERINIQPEIALVLGSGLGSLADEVENAVTIKYYDIPGFPASTVDSHAGEMKIGILAGKSVLIMSGRSHYYEGYDAQTVSYYVRVFKLLDINKLILTNAVGGVNKKYSIGDFMIINDHIKLFNVSPVRGKHEPYFGERFFDLTNAYSKKLINKAKKAAKRVNQPVHEGIYFFMPGPEFETPAEINAIRLLGGDVVGMSTVMEVITAAQCGISTLGVSCVTNMAAGMVENKKVSHEEVTVNAAEFSNAFKTLMKEIIKEI